MKAKQVLATLALAAILAATPTQAVSTNIPPPIEKFAPFTYRNWIGTIVFYDNDRSIEKRISKSLSYRTDSIIRIVIVNID